MGRYYTLKQEYKFSYPEDMNKNPRVLRSTRGS